MLERDDYRCRKCRVWTAEQVHHLVPVAGGGAYWDPANLIAVCRPCHRALHDMRTDAQREWDSYLQEPGSEEGAVFDIEVKGIDELIAQLERFEREAREEVA